MCQDARRKSTFINLTDVLIHSTKYLDRESTLFTEDGLHMFSLSDVIHHHGISHIFNSIKEAPSYDFFHSLDVSHSSLYHYAALYNFDDAFEYITQCKMDKQLSKCIDHRVIKSLCLHNQPESLHTVPSILIEKDRMHTLASCIHETLKIDPFSSEFDDVYVTWLHESILSDAKSTANYLQTCHKRKMESALQRDWGHFSKEPMSPMDIALSAPHNNQMYYIDFVLKDFVGGYRLSCTSIDLLLSRIKHIQKLTTDHVCNLIEKCIIDNIITTI